MTRAQRTLSKWAIFVIALIVPLGVHALGLGEARVESYLNQPLDVRMRLLDVSNDDLDSLSVTPASAEDFERLGLMSDSLALDLQINVDRSVSPPILRVTSARPVSDPVVQLLVDARWASGRMLREYTLFLDPPTVAVEAPAPATESAQRVEPADAEDRPQQAAASRPAPARTTQESPAQPPRPVAVSGASSYGPVASGDTLWSIARQNLPAGDVTMDQMMIAIVELNPNAFRDRNINQLLRGARLQLPDYEQTRALDAAAAAAEVAAQNRAFRRRTTSEIPVVSSAGRDSAPATEQPRSGDVAGRPEEIETAESVDHRLSLVPPGEEESGSGLSGDAAEVADLKQRLARAEEELYSARQEAEEFQARVEDLEIAMRDNPGGIGLRDAELAGLEATLRAAREATQEDADPQMRSEVSERLQGYLEQYAAADQASGAGGQPAMGGLDAGEGAPVDGALAADNSGESTTDDSAEPVAAANVDSAPAAERTEIENQSSRGLMSSPILLLAAALVLLLLGLAIAWLALRKRREQAERVSPLKRAADMTPVRRRPVDPVEAARTKVASNPDDLSAHLGLLQTLTSVDSESEFGEALDAMYVRVESDSEPKWREALELAARVVPGHSLVKGSTDWVAETPREDTAHPVSEVDEESEVDDLMTRLDADLDESDDFEWLDDDKVDEDADSKAPLLRDDEDSGPTPDFESDVEESVGDARKVVDDDEEEAIDLSAWRDDEGPAADDAQADGARSAAVADEDDDEDLMIGWSDEDEPAEDAGADRTLAVDEALDEDDAEKSSDSSAEEAEDDIFAQSDDDIDVKLDLAKAYLSWNSSDSARTLLEEVAREGNESQQEEARELLGDLSDGSDN